ncbi:toll/interleukin-1 receptor domain-containing protein [Pelagibacterium sp. H642]|uniref:toll/interleukin-1 receptor domain-containing protein n=1 Tax=Pelagibacterium sp. H642 TaxID=1881069 RepID=UPI002814B6EC|nr:toll/interleukin-1 receptor domain-containing protein [Pelagibacterium sp. H642]WMT92001.1 toll/interleukin-1 receptor domain-containing protein [Pelagibacterium sp. H642]
MNTTTIAQKSSAKKKSISAHRFEPARLDSLFVALDAVAWLDAPTTSQIAQFAGIDARTAGKLVKNACQIGMLEPLSKGYVLKLAYPYDGKLEQKETVVREALLKMPLISALKQFMKLGDDLNVALRKAATIQGIAPFVASDLNPLVEWANRLGALEKDLLAEDLVDQAEAKKQIRHKEDSNKRIAFLSHSSKDKPFVRQLAADLKSKDVDVWLDEQRIRVGDSIPEKIAQGLAESDYFLIGISNASNESEWVKKELNNALVNEVQRRHVHVLPLKLDDAAMPAAIADKKYADFSKSYKSGLADLLLTLKGHH